MRKVFCVISVALISTALLGVAAYNSPDDVLGLASRQGPLQARSSPAHDLPTKIH